MKTPALSKKFPHRETLAWLVLTCALVLFGMTLSFAQEPETKITEGKIRVKIEKEENGKKVKLDTTFDVKDYDKMQETIRSFDENFDMPEPPEAPPLPGEEEDGNSFYSRTYSGDEMFTGDMKEDMEKLKEDMKDLQKELMKLKFEMFSDSSLPVFRHNWMRMEADSGDFFEFKKGAWDGMKHGCSVRVRTSTDGDVEEAEAESGKAGEGDRVIILKRSSKKHDENKKETGDRKSPAETSTGKLETAGLEYYPNPGDGKFTLAFRLETKGNTSISITDPSGKEIYYETLKDFSGSYNRQVDIRSHGKGTYLLRISQNNKSISKKLVVD